jgi:hypothetical protein
MKTTLAFLTFASLAVASCGGSPPPPGSEPPRVPGPGVSSPSGQLAQLAFMTGSWISDDGETEELWLPPKGETMLGIARTVKEGRTVFFEFLRIEIEGGTITMFASPRGKPPVPFKLTESSNAKAVFANPDHDDPKKISYEREGDGLRATTEGASIQSTRMRRR